jgi:hypothetical protein
LARFNDVTIKVTNPNQELFVGAFQNGHRAGQFNESLAQKPADSLEEIMSRAECYSKVKKVRQRRRKEMSGNEVRAGRKKGYYPSANKDRGTFKKADCRQEGYRRDNPHDSYTPLNAKREQIFQEAYHSKILRDPFQPQSKILGGDIDAYCKYHRMKGKTTDD